MIAITDHTGVVAERGASAGGWIARTVSRLAENRRLAAEREVARFITSHGGRLTDEVERRIGQSLV